MAVNVKFVPIRATKPITKANSKRVEHEMRRLRDAVHGRLSKYPPQKPTVSGYRRTGETGRRWVSRGPELVSNDLTVTVGNNLPHVGYVQGFTPDAPVPAEQKQSREMQSRDWESVEVVGADEYKKHAKDIRDAVQGR